MSPVKNLAMHINDGDINVAIINGEDYICLTDMAKSAGADRALYSWIRSKNTISFLGLWEQFHNSDFKLHEFVYFKNNAGANSFNPSVSEWIDKTNAIGIVTKKGRYGGTYAHKDIAFEFGSWLSPEFKLLIIVEFQRLKAKEQKIIEWDSTRYLSRINYRLHTDSIKDYILPAISTPKVLQKYIYTDEADILNMITFGQSASDWRSANPSLAKSGKNQRDYATIEQLAILANLENLNAHYIAEGKTKNERIQIMAKSATRQYGSFMKQNIEQEKINHNQIAIKKDGV